MIVVVVVSVDDMSESCTFLPRFVAACRRRSSIHHRLHVLAAMIGHVEQQVLVRLSQRGRFGQGFER